MKNHQPLFVLALALAACLAATGAHAQPTVAPGGTIVFTAADGGSVTCRRLAPISCVPGIVDGSDDPSGRSVFARSLIPVTGAGVPNYATATIYNDFTIAGSGVDTVVDAQIDVTYDFFSSINVAVLSKVGADLSLSIVDVGFGFPIPVAASDIVSTNRTSDNGVTDVSQGTENNNLSGANAHFQAKLRRGHTYQLQFKLETLGEVSLLGVARVVSDAGWRRLAVTIDEDEVEQLSRHDSDMKALLATHDTDIKELLEEVIRLLNTPTGRRPDFPIK
jgi:hypothetical protein